MGNHLGRKVYIPMIQNYWKEKFFPKGTFYYLDCYLVGVAVGVGGGGRMSNTFGVYVKGLRSSVEVQPFPSFYVKLRLY